jgi:hypothetical protein
VALAATPRRHARDEAAVRRRHVGCTVARRKETPMLTLTRPFLALALVSSLSAGCVMAEDDLADPEAELEEAEAVSTGLKIQRRTVPPGSEVMDLSLTSSGSGGLFQVETHFCKAVGSGSECTTMLCANLKLGEDHGCEVTCGYSCDGTPDDCLGQGC